MMAMMEKYANNLEVLVDERTDQLQEEKKKTGNLPYKYNILITFYISTGPAPFIFHFILYVLMRGPSMCFLCIGNKVYSIREF